MEMARHVKELQIYWSKDILNNGILHPDTLYFERSKYYVGMQVSKEVSYKTSFSLCKQSSILQEKMEIL